MIRNAPYLPWICSVHLMSKSWLRLPKIKRNAVFEIAARYGLRSLRKAMNLSIFDDPSIMVIFHFLVSSRFPGSGVTDGPGMGKRKHRMRRWAKPLSSTHAETDRAVALTDTWNPCL